MTADRKISKTQEMVYEMKVRDVMTRQVISVRPDERMSGLRALLSVNRISGLPVVRGDELVGLVSVEDFMKWLVDRAEAPRRAPPAWEELRVTRRRILPVGQMRWVQVRRRS